MLRAKNIHCMRNSRTLFEDVSFSVREGEIFQVIGNNGVGKSSLLRIIAGLLQPHAGYIAWQHPTISSEDFHTQLFYLGHLLAIKSELTVKENLNATHHDFQKILQAWSLDSFQHHLCSTLSQGQKQRVALARLQLSHTKIWILDEPFSHLDATGVSQLENLLKTHANNGGLIVLSTHCELSIGREINQPFLSLL